MNDEPLLSGLKILIVEDDVIIAEAMSDSFVRAAATVIGPAFSVRQALGLIGETRPDAAVVDINLNGELAFPVADRLRADGIPFVFATGFDASDIPEHYATIGHCSKPVDPATLAEAFSWLNRKPL